MPLSIICDNNELASIYNIFKAVRRRYESQDYDWISQTMSTFNNIYRSQEQHLMVFADYELRLLESIFALYMEREGRYDRKKYEVCENVLYVLQGMRSQREEKEASAPAWDTGGDVWDTGL